MTKQHKNKKQTVKNNWWLKFSDEAHRLWRRAPETVVMMLGWAVAQLLLSWLWTAWWVGQTWRPEICQTIAMWRDFFGWASLLALTYRFFLESKWRERYSFTKKWPESCQVSMVALAGGLLIYLATGGVMHAVIGIETAASVRIQWQQIVMVLQGSLLVMIASCALFYLLETKKKRNWGTMLTYIVRHLVLSEVTGGIILIGIFFAVILIDNLFGLELYEMMFIIVSLCMMIGPAFYLMSKRPAKDDNLQKWQPVKFWNIVGMKIILPLCVLYDAILDLYLIKQLLIWQWPEYGMVNLVLWYAIGVTVWRLLAEYYFENKQVTAVQRTMTQIINSNLWILIFLAYWGLGVRVQTLGWTLPRWLVVCGLAWVIQSWPCINKKQSTVWLIMNAIVSMLACIGSLLI